MTGSQLERAVGAAKVQSDIGESAAAFANVLESEGLEEARRHLGPDRAAPAVHPQPRCSCCRVLGLICRHENGASGGITSS